MSTTNQQSSALALAPCSLPVGTRIRFLRTLTESPCEDHPGLIFARKGDGGEVTGHGCPEGHWVKWDNWHAPFGAVLGEEFEAENVEMSHAPRTDSK